MVIILTTIYLLVSYFSLFRISFDVVWNSSSYRNFDGGILFLYFLFMVLPCIFSFILSSRKVKVLRQDAFLYLCGIILCFVFNNTNPHAGFEYDSVLFLLKSIAFITIYATIFNVYQLFKINSQKPKEKKKDRKLEEEKSFKEKEAYQKEYFESLDNK